MLNPNDKINYIKEHIEFINKYPNEVWSKIFELEELFKIFFNINNASACSSWSTWLLLALKALWIKYWDEVILNCNYFISDPNSVLLAWAKPIYIDLWTTINSLSLDDIKKKVTNKTKAIIIIHLDWYPIENTIEIIKYCKESNILVIEDCCQSIWAKIWNNYIWTLWDIWIFSFDTNKMVKWWEWWMIITKDKKKINIVNLYKNNYKENWDFINLWFNYRYNDFSAIYAKYSFQNLLTYIEKRKNEILEISEKTNYKIYKGRWITPVYYNLIIEKDNSDLLNKKDYLDLNLNNYPNFKFLYSKFKIISLSNNIYSNIK